MREMAGYFYPRTATHVPTIMLPRQQRFELNEGQEISLVPGLRRLRSEVFDVLDYETVIILDSHWHTTVEFVVAAHPVRAGLFTSDELPRGMQRIPTAGAAIRSLLWPSPPRPTARVPGSPRSMTPACRSTTRP